MTPTATPSKARRALRGNPWAPTFRGVMLVTRIDLMRRKPSAKGYIFYGLVFAAITALGIIAAVVAGPGKNSIPLELVLVLVLGVGFLIGPSLSATAINGDSGEGVLAPMQMTRLTAGDLVVGKLLATWLVSVLALITAVPFMAYAFGRSGWSAGEVGIVLGVILFEVLVATTFGLAWSSIAARSAVSVALTHITTGFLAFGTVVVYFFTLPLVSDTVTVKDRNFDWSNVTIEQQNDPDFDYTTLPCIDNTYDVSVAHSEHTAWMLLINPVVVVGEASPIINPETYKKDGRAAPGLFAAVHKGVGGVRLGPVAPQSYDSCANPNGVYDDGAWQKREDEEAMISRMPWLGLGLQLVLGIGAITVAIRRLRVPYKKLRGGTRVA